MRTRCCVWDTRVSAAVLCCLRVVPLLLLQGRTSLQVVRWATKTVSAWGWLSSS